MQGKDYQSRFQYKNSSGLCSADYIQSVTLNLSLGTEVLWQPEHNISQISFGARYNTNKMIASGRVWNEGAISLSYVQILSEKVSLASEIEYDPPSRYFLSSIGYEYKFREVGFCSLPLNAIYVLLCDLPYIFIEVSQ
ncbi:mitochondrial import receptor subunit TOM40-1-like [Carex rostrata]